MPQDGLVSTTFRALAEKAESKFARVLDVRLHPYGRIGAHYGRLFHNVFKAYMRLWKYQQENRMELVESGLQRWKIGEIASRIGQLYLNQFLMVSLILNCGELANLLIEKLKALVEDSRTNFPDTNFREWKLVLQEIMRFRKSETACLNRRPLCYHAIFDSYPASLPYVARYNAKRLLKFKNALLTSYHKNEVKFPELTLDTFRMLQFLEWEPSGSFFQKPPAESTDNGTLLPDHSVISGLMDMKLVAEMTDPTLPPNPKKAVLYRPSVTQLLNVISAICEELPLDNVMLIYLSAQKCLQSNPDENRVKAKVDTSYYFDKHLWLGRSRNGVPSVLFPGDIIPFTRRPLFLILDSDNSHAFKILHEAERSEPAALFLSPLRPSFIKPSGANMPQNGSQFTLFLTAPLQAFCQMVDYNSSGDSNDMYNEAETIVSSAFAQWEVILCTSTDVDHVWAQLLSDPFLRRVILRFIFCHAVLALLQGKDYQNLPICLPELPSSLSPNSKAIQPSIRRLANHLKVADKCSRSTGFPPSESVHLL